MVKIKKRRRKSGEVAGRKEAIRNMCMECMGYEIAEIKRCTALKCWLYPWRLGALDEETINAEKVENKKDKKDKEDKVSEAKTPKSGGFKFTK